ncbi:M12 family metallopeptidase [Pseudomonas fluorescens]|uniref:M12 family metallopeptidase n=1 Tax=Pseudomonas fluorescens TaxID=294 RepID=UPI0021D0D67E|nr:M12 family metallopeptidase [Pseudomonas fluorescens]UXV21087.1 M12 family metallopeptidase [Pseudomonas fluorescens]
MTLPIPPHYAPAYALHDTAADPIETPHPALIRNKRGVADPDKTWPQHSVLNISLLNMTQEQKKWVKHNINQWAPHTNLYFKFVDTPHGDIRIIANNDTSNAWSKIGTDAKKVAQPTPTMSIGFKGSPANIAARVQHEFGHALGLKHEHQHPDQPLEFNNQTIYDDYESWGKFQWQADHNIIQKLPHHKVKVSPYDKTSIMHYGFPASWLSNGNPIPSSTHLSEGDKRFIQSLYPTDNSFFGKLLNTSIRAMINA